MHFDHDEFQRLQHEYGIFTIEATASCQNNLCPMFATDAKDFIQMNLQGETVFMCQTSSDGLPAMLQHFEKHRR